MKQKDLIQAALDSAEAAAVNFDDGRHESALILANIAQAEAAAAIAQELRRLNDKLDSVTNEDGDAIQVWDKVGFREWASREGY